eukprot:513612-Lingulodinium_polyedra.AAC.1
MRRRKPTRPRRCKTNNNRRRSSQGPAKAGPQYGRIGGSCCFASSTSCAVRSRGAPPPSK